jgi:predicted NAD/FAD-binding protein
MPHLTAMFAHLGVASVETEMSFAVSLEEPAMEWAGSSLATVFGQKRNLLRPDFWRMLADILRFNRESVAWIEQLSRRRRQPARLPRRRAAIRALRRVVPAADGGGDLVVPGRADARLSRCQLRALLPQSRLAAGLRPAALANGQGRWPRIRQESWPPGSTTSAWHAGAQRAAYGCRPATASPMAVEHYDQVVLACHSDQALAILALRRRPQSVACSGRSATPNRAVLHSDAALLPRNRQPCGRRGTICRAPGTRSTPGQRLVPDQPPAATALQDTADGIAEPAAPAAGASGDRRIRLRAPDFRRPAIAAQRELPAISGKRGVWFCGAWNGYGFHEDGLKSALAGGQRPGLPRAVAGA